MEGSGERKLRWIRVSSSVFCEFSSSLVSLVLLWCRLFLASKHLDRELTYLLLLYSSLSSRKNPPVIPQALLEKPREGSVDSGNSSSHSSTSLPDSLSHSPSPPELVFASIASYDMNAAPIRPISSNHNNHNHARPSPHQTLSSSHHVPNLVYPVPPSVIGSSSASASSGSSVASPTGSPSPSGEMALLDPVEEEVGGDLGSRRGRTTRGGRPGGGPSTSEGSAILVPSLSAMLSSPTSEGDDSGGGTTSTTTKEEPETPLFASILRPMFPSASMPAHGEDTRREMNGL